MFSFSETEFMPRFGFHRSEAWTSFESRLSSFAQPWAQSVQPQPEVVAPTNPAPFAGRFFGQFMSVIVSGEDQVTEFQLPETATAKFTTGVQGSLAHLITQGGDISSAFSADDMAASLPIGAASAAGPAAPNGLTSGDDGYLPTSFRGLVRSADTADDRQGASPLLGSGDDWPNIVWLPDLVRTGDDPGAAAPSGEPGRVLPDLPLEHLTFFSNSLDFLPTNGPDAPPPPAVDWAGLIGTAPQGAPEADPNPNGPILSLDLFGLDGLGGVIDVSSPITGGPGHDAANDPAWMNRHIAHIQ
ncbi:MAG: hypothetical protein ACOYJ6_01965 [Caulobacterales bacterium]